jgi:hypothetical protein
LVKIMVNQRPAWFWVRLDLVADDTRPLGAIEQQQVRAKFFDHPSQLDERVV